MKSPQSSAQKGTSHEDGFINSMRKEWTEQGAKMYKRREGNRSGKHESISSTMYPHIHAGKHSLRWATLCNSASRLSTKLHHLCSNKKGRQLMIVHTQNRSMNKGDHPIIAKQLSRSLPTNDRPVWQTLGSTNHKWSPKSEVNQLKEDNIRNANPKMTHMDEVAEKTNGKRSQ